MSLPVYHPTPSTTAIDVIGALERLEAHDLIPSPWQKGLEHKWTNESTPPGPGLRLNDPGTVATLRYLLQEALRRLGNGYPVAVAQEEWRLFAARQEYEQSGRPCALEAQQGEYMARALIALANEVAHGEKKSD